MIVTIITIVCLLITPTVHIIKIFKYYKKVHYPTDDMMESYYFHKDYRIKLTDTYAMFTIELVMSLIIIGVLLTVSMPIYANILIVIVYHMSLVMASYGPPGGPR